MEECSTSSPTDGTEEGEEIKAFFPCVLVFFLSLGVCLLFCHALFVHRGDDQGVNRWKGVLSWVIENVEDLIF